jgi:23S rRNA pseudouridine1911/1915/1917 synthase
MPIRLDLLVARRFGLSRRAAQEAVLNGRVDLDGARCDEPGLMVDEESAQVAHVPSRPKARHVRQAPVKVLYEDGSLLVVDKPAGVLTLPTAGHEPDTLVDRARRYLAIRHGEARPYVGIVHRLDRETSGALAFARSPEALRAFQDLFRRHAVERRYLAVVEGTPSREAGTIDLPLTGQAGQVRQRVADAAEDDPEARDAVTHYRVVERFGPVASLVSCWLETGRTHQIRVHLSRIGHPVVGDSLYRPPGRPRSKARFGRQALHAQTLALMHPLTGVAVRVESPPPPDLAALILDLRLRFGIPGAGG